MNTNSNDSPENKIKRKPDGNRNKTIHRLLFTPIVNTLHKVKTSLPIRRNSRVHGVSPLSTKQNPLRKKGGKTRKNRKTKRK
jgi:hypothetical protein